ncbi:hypothetical protein FALBO_7648 [Fusarium albosuccineum]|uniref:Uncharacterized protein n=1 Tax=Fusarium albosuccineum TaxID=1237068 RepID=A0A8H4LCG2_9HYPO|nr:hypothetical protein FALBO_7648 [Fusarium albosuccineum]
MSMPLVDPNSQLASIRDLDIEWPDAMPPPSIPTPPPLPVCEQINLREPDYLELRLRELTFEYAFGKIKVWEEGKKESQRRFLAGECCSGTTMPTPPPKCRFHIDKMEWERQKEEAIRRPPSPPTVSIKFSAPAPAPSLKEGEDKKDPAIGESQRE